MQFRWLVLFISAISLLQGCSITSSTRSDGPPSQAPDFDSIPDATPRAEAPARYGNMSSYNVFGKTYHVMDSSKNYVERGIASWYGSKFHGRKTSSGEVYDMYEMTAAHKSLPLPTYAKVTNLENGKSIIVKINDRGPFHENRIIDLSYVAAGKLGILKKGTGYVEVKALDPFAPDLSPAPILATPAAKPVPTKLPIASVKTSVKLSAPELFIQIGAFKNIDNAHRLKLQLTEQLPIDVRIHYEDSVENPWYQVWVGPLASTQFADELTVQLQNLGFHQTRIVIPD